MISKLTTEEREQFRLARDYFTRYFNGEDLPDINNKGAKEYIVDLQKQWAREARKKAVKAKLSLRAKRRREKSLEKQKAAAKIACLRTIDCCLNCGYSDYQYGDITDCSLFPRLEITKDSVCNKYKVRGST